MEVYPILTYNTKCFAIYLLIILVLGFNRCCTVKFASGRVSEAVHYHSSFILRLSLSIKYVLFGTYLV